MNTKGRANRDCTGHSTAACNSRTEGRANRDSTGHSTAACNHELRGRANRDSTGHSTATCNHEHSRPCQSRLHWTLNKATKKTTTKA
eukprot:1845847-Amphidinium_carterae.1